jgi:hypothetical protein
MQLSSFWPPRRAWDRVASLSYQRRHPDVPWLTQGAIELLPDLFRPTDRCLEWGSGTSTAWLATRLGGVLSVEHDPQWYERVRLSLLQRGLASESVRLLSIEPEADPSASPYVRAIDEFGDGELDVCLIDGEHRLACAEAAIPKLAAGGVLVIDDAHGYFDHPSRSPHSRYGKGPLDAGWAGIGAAVSGWRHIWTSDGYSDTAIWIKP